ncbi:MAG: mechanosensitive ion channel family protein [Chloroflexi bacterium]|nr:mechanosensitive ion channel family protein [Chloroflexota bacterium]
MDILGLQVALPTWLECAATPLGSLALNLLAWVLIVLIVYWLLITVVRRLTRRSRSRLDDALMRILRWPVVVMLLAYGLLDAVRRAWGETEGVAVLAKLYRGVLIVLGAYVAWRVLFEIIVAYLAPRVQESDSQADDVLVPMLRRIGPVIIIIAVANAVVATLGGNLNTLLAGLGLLGLVLGYLLQEPLQGLFSGTYMSLDNPFHEDDLLILEDGTTCQVRSVGVRVTQLYDVRRHILTYLPNSRLAGSKITNLTKPSVELRTVLTATFPKPCNGKEAIALVQEACNSHENILGIWTLKDRAIRNRLAVYREEAERLQALPTRAAADEWRLFWLHDHVKRVEGDLIRLHVEHKLRENGEHFSAELLELARYCQEAQVAGFTQKEQQQVRQRANVLMDHYDALIEQITVWLYLVRTVENELTDQAQESTVTAFIEKTMLADGILTLEELRSCGAPYTPERPVVLRQELDRIRDSASEADLAVAPDSFVDRASYIDYRRLYTIWHRNITHVYRELRRLARGEHSRSDRDHTLAERVRLMERHFADSFLLRVSYRQLPMVNLVDANGAELKFEVAFFVDDVVREHFQRKDRVVTEFLMELERLRAANAESLAGNICT